MALSHTVPAIRAPTTSRPGPSKRLLLRRRRAIHSSPSPAPPLRAGLRSKPRCRRSGTLHDGVKDANRSFVRCQAWGVAWLVVANGTTFAVLGPPRHCLFRARAIHRGRGEERPCRNVPQESFGTVLGGVFSGGGRCADSVPLLRRVTETSAARKRRAARHATATNVLRTYACGDSLCGFFQRSKGCPGQTSREGDDWHFDMKKKKKRRKEEEKKRVKVPRLGFPSSPRGRA